MDLARLVANKADSNQQNEAITEDKTREEETTSAPAPPNTVKSLMEAITLAVMSGICGPSLFALIGCGIRQIRLTWDDPFAGGERPVDEAAERRKRKTQQKQLKDEDGNEESANNNYRHKTASNNLDPMILDTMTSLDLDQIRAKQLPSARYSNTDKNPAGKVNKGYSKTVEDIM